jgi:hypothetical protein
MESHSDTAISVIALILVCHSVWWSSHVVLCGNSLLSSPPWSWTGMPKKRLYDVNTKASSVIDELCKIPQYATDDLFGSLIFDKHNEK